jgi:hypothetical protein
MEDPLQAIGAIIFIIIVVKIMVLGGVFAYLF